MAKEEPDNDAVKVVVRVKPLSDRDRSCLYQPSDYQLKCGPDSQLYTFDKIAGEHASQEEIFQAAGEPLVDRCLEGFNCCIFTYGQTGSGKTWTMWGHLPDPDSVDILPPEAGLIPRMYQMLFLRIAEEERRMGGKSKFTCKCSIVEIYNETITDLLNPDSGNLALRESKKDGVYIECVTQRRVDTVAAVMDLVSEGSENRQVAETNMNHESSRSHVVLVCTIAWKTVDENGIVTSKCSRLNLVDLAGSERQKSTNAKGDRLKEACGINKSLSTLGHVIMSLGDHQQGKDNHVPYRDSKLTFLLQDSLGGNSKTVMIANLSPSLKNMDESLSTLRFARGAKKIKNKAVINESHGGDVTALREEIARLKAEVAQLKYREAERTAKGSSGAYTPTSMDSGYARSGSVTPTSTTFTLTDSRSDMMEDLEEVYTLRTERNCTACKELKFVLKQVWEEKAQVLEDSILLAAQLTASRLEVDAAQSAGSRAVEKQKRMGEEVIAQLVSELELVKGAQKEENTSQISHAQAKMALARRRSMKAVHSTSCDWSSECGSQGLEDFTDETAVVKQLSRERNVMESLFIQEDKEGVEIPNAVEASIPITEFTPFADSTSTAFSEVRKRGSLSPSVGSREVGIMDEIKEHPEDEGLESGAGQVALQEANLVDITDHPLSVSSKEDHEEHGISCDLQQTHALEGKEEPQGTIPGASEELLDVDNAYILADESDNSETDATNEVDTGTVPDGVPENDERRLKKAWFEGTGGMKRADVALSAVAVAVSNSREIEREVIRVTPVPNTTSVNKRKSYFKWLTCCFGGSRIQVVEPLTP